jgi:hypothetical protein
MTKKSLSFVTRYWPQIIAIITAIYLFAETQIRLAHQDEKITELKQANIRLEIKIDKIYEILTMNRD